MAVCASPSPKQVCLHHAIWVAVAGVVGKGGTIGGPYDDSYSAERGRPGLAGVHHRTGTVRFYCIAAMSSNMRLIISAAASFIVMLLVNNWQCVLVDLGDFQSYLSVPCGHGI